MHEFMQNTVMRHALCVMQITDTPRRPMAKKQIKRASCAHHN